MTEEEFEKLEKIFNEMQRDLMRVLAGVQKKIVSLETRIIRLENQSILRKMKS